MSESRLYYLAQAYSSPDPLIMEYRHRQALKCAAYLMRKGLTVFSPLAHSHRIAVEEGLPQTWEFWRKQDFAILARCDELLVLTLEGWLESVGVQAEIQFSQTRGIPITALLPSGSEYEFAEYLDGVIVRRGK